MIILSKKKFHFKAGGNHFTTKGGMIIEEAPDWIASLPFYQWAKDDGDIVEVKNSSAEAEDVAVAKAKDDGDIVEVKDSSEEAEDVAVAKAKRTTRKTAAKK